MVEFALVLPILLLLVMGIIQFGILFNNYVTLTDGVRAGARQAAVSRTLPDPVTPAKNRVKSSAAGLDAAKLDITATWVQGGDVTVEAKYPFKIKLFGVVVMDGKLKSKTTERVE